MAENLVIEAPDFDKIREKAGVATHDAIKTLWAVLNQEIKLRRLGDRDADIKVISDAPTAQQDNYDAGLRPLTLVYFTGGTAFTITGAKSSNEGHILIFHITGTATVTFAHNSGASLAANRFRMSSGGNETRATDTSVVFLFLNTLWRELVP